MIEVLKQALEALETEVSIDWTNNDEFNASAEKMHDAITSLRQAIAELESQEPVAIVREQFVRIGNKDNFQRRLRIAGLEGNHLTMSSLKVNDKLYAHPPQRTWVGLTDGEIVKIVNANSSKGLYLMAKAIEAKLKEKNT